MSAPSDQPAPASLAPKPTRALYAIGLKVASVCVFVVMSSLLKAAEGIPSGQLVFYRSLFAIVPIGVYLAWRGQLFGALKTTNPGGHFLRALIGVSSMLLGFYGLTVLPLPESIAFTYAAPLLIVVFSAVLLKEQVHFFRWSAVVVGLVGVIIMLWPRLTVFSGGDPVDRGVAIGALAALAGAALTAFAMMQVRKLVQTERTETIVIYLSINASMLSLATAFFGWVWPTPEQAVLLVLAGCAGGIGQILLTSSYRHAEMSVIAPFEYTSLLLGLVIGYFAFGDVPTIAMVVGAAIIVGSGIAVILREHRLGLDRAKAREANTP